jgi:hypothetical protein
MVLKDRLLQKKKLIVQFRYFHLIARHAYKCRACFNPLTLDMDI